MAPYRYDPYVPQGDSIGALLLQRGDIAARAATTAAAAQGRAAEVGGQAWGRASEQAGQIVGNLPAQIQAQRDAQQQRTVRDIEVRKAQAGEKIGALIAQHTTTTDDGHLSYDVGAFMDAAKADPVLASFAHEPADAMQKSNDTYQQFREGRFATKQALIQKLYGQAAEAGGTPDDFQVMARPFILGGVLDAADLAPMFQRLSQLPDGRARVMLLNAAAGVKPEYKDVSRGGTLVQTMPGTAPQTVMQGAPEPPTAEQTITDAYIGSLGKPAGTTWDKLTPQEQSGFPTYKQQQGASSELKPVLYNGKQVFASWDPKTKALTYNGQDITNDAKPIPAASIQINQAEQGDLDDQAEQVLSGNLPPSMLSKRSSSYNAILAKANEKSKARTGKALNIGKLELDYKAASKWVQGMNGPQMIRFKGLATSVVNTIDEVKRLGDELKQGGIQKWNSVSRKTIQQVYGNTPQSELANQYMVAVNTLKEEFANLANGGYAPTEAAWGLANSQINGNYGFKDLNSSLDEVQRLINYRVNAFDEVTPTTFGGPSTGGSNPPAPSTAPKEGTEGTVAGKPAIWKTVNGVAGWYAK